MVSCSSGERFLRLATAFIATSTAVLTSQAIKPQEKTKSVSGGGKQLFASNCAACHGLDGKGSERAPNIADGANIRRMAHAQIFGIIQNGVPGTGMPAFHTLSATQIDALISHLRILGGASKPAAPLPGDPGAGKALFTGEAGCSRCHMVTGEGGFIASNLSDYGRGHSAEQIRGAITKPVNTASGSARTATVTLRGGERYTGRIRNEDNFSIQLQDLTGVFHLLTRSDVATFDYDSKSMMPSDYASTLTSNELDDLVSFLMKAAQDSHEATADKANDED